MVNRELVSTSLDIPTSVYSDIENQHSEDEDSADQQHMQGVFEWYLANHPAPSWLHVATALYNSAEEDLVYDLTNKVECLKGKFC